MKVELHNISIREVVNDYVDNQEDGITGFGGRLNIRPQYQREFIYKDKERNAVINTIMKGFPLNVIYWAVDASGNYEVLDGQQRTISFCQFANGDFSLPLNGHIKGFPNLTAAEQKQFLDYKLMVYFCEGDDQDKLDWFKIVNISGMKLYDQELRNAVYTGSWLTHAKSIFSKTNCAAHNLSKNYLRANSIRQEILETALKWLSNGEIEKYMAHHQHDQDANELWMYFRNVIEWVKLTFTVYRNEMKFVNWGELFNDYHDTNYNTDDLESKVKKLMMDDDITNKNGIYPYVLTGKESYLSIRSFSDSIKRTVFEKQNGECKKCGALFNIENMEADHITPWSKGGKTVLENCQILCKRCNRLKSAI